MAKLSNLGIMECNLE